MSKDNTRARNRYFALAAIRLVGAAGGVFGLVLLGRATTTAPRVLGGALVLAALAVIAIVPRSLARRWRTPPS
jgi:ABC-type proline/glycine betaine transport system permease subunit